MRASRVREPIDIAVAQPLCVPFGVGVNAEAHAATIRKAGARVVVFPELSLTGYELDAPAITAADPRLAPVLEACAETGTLALVGAPLMGEASQSHIAMLAVDGSGVTVAYRKLWVDSTEAHRFTAGSKPEVLEVDGWRLGLAICKDTGIRQHCADTAALGMDVYVAGTLMLPREASIQDERGQRIATEHQVWVAFASFAGSTGAGYDESAGRSGIWNPSGVLVAQAGAETGAIARVTIS